MRYIDLNKNIEIKNMDQTPSGTSISLREWFLSFVLVDAKLGVSASALMSAADVKKKVAESEKILELSDHEWSLLKNVVEVPSSGYNTPIAIQLVPFIRDFLNAKDAK